jgi:hypothetical protein
MKNFLRLRTLAIGSCMAILLSAFTMTIQPADFSGSWTLNEGKSDLGQFGARGAASKIVIAQQADGIKIDRTSTGFSGEEVNSTELLTNDGKEVESTVFGSSKRKASIKWNNDQSGFTVTFSINLNMNGQSFDLTGTETWSIGADGKSMTMENKINTPNGEISTKAVYDKQ